MWINANGLINNILAVVIKSLAAFAKTLAAFAVKQELFLNRKGHEGLREEHKGKNYLFLSSD